MIRNIIIGSLFFLILIVAGCSVDSDGNVDPSTAKSSVHEREAVEVIESELDVALAEIDVDDVEEAIVSVQ